MSQPNHQPFDFNSWAALAKDDAEAFERRRQEVIEQAIEQAPEHLRERLRGLQWRIDVERRRYKHPLKACAAIYNMMWESMYGRDGLLMSLQGLHSLQQKALGEEGGKPGRVLPFRR